MEGTCPRCGGATGESRWCPTCGKELTGKPSLPTPEAADAARREAAWLEEHRDVADAEAQAADAAARERAAYAPPVGVPPAAWQAPAVPGQPQPPPGPHVHGAMRADPPQNPSGRAQVVRWLMYAQILAAVVVLILEFVYLSVLGDIDADEWAGSKRVDDALIAVGIGYIAQFLLLVVTAGFFIAWLSRVYKNVRGLGAGDLRYGEGWAIGGWFVPIMWWWRPKEIVNDSWRASDPKLPLYTARHEWQDAAVPGVITAWWASWILLGILNRVANRMSLNADTLAEDRSATIVGMTSGPVLIVAALLAIKTVNMITDRQNERAAAREQMGPAQPAPGPPAAPPAPV